MAKIGGLSSRMRVARGKGARGGAVDEQETYLFENLSRVQLRNLAQRLRERADRIESRLRKEAA